MITSSATITFSARRRSHAGRRASDPWDVLFPSDVRRAGGKLVDAVPCVDCADYSALMRSSAPFGHSPPYFGDVLLLRVVAEGVDVRGVDLLALRRGRTRGWLLLVAELDDVIVDGFLGGAAWNFACWSGFMRPRPSW